MLLRCFTFWGIRPLLSGGGRRGERPEGFFEIILNGREILEFGYLILNTDESLTYSLLHTPFKIWFRIVLSFGLYNCITEHDLVCPPDGRVGWCAARGRRWLEAPRRRPSAESMVIITKVEGVVSGSEGIRDVRVKGIVELECQKCKGL